MGNSLQLIGSIAFMALVVILTRIFFDRRSRRTHRQPAPEWHPSFSILAFCGDVSADIEDLLDACGYTVLNRTREADMLFGLMQDLRAADSVGNTMRKAYFVRDGWTILIDPESVLVADTEGCVASFCNMRGVQAWGGLWDWPSRTAVVRDLTRSDSSAGAGYVADKQIPEFTGSIPALATSRDDRGVKAALSEVGVPVEAVFAENPATVLELRD